MKLDEKLRQGTPLITPPRTSDRPIYRSAFTGSRHESGNAAGDTTSLPAEAAPCLPRTVGTRPCRVRLYCFPHLGGGTAGYHSWSRGLSDDIELAPIFLPGRESRLLEPPVDSMPALIDEMASAITLWADVPFAFFGHSMGAVIAFELARRLQIDGEPAPICLFVSSCPAPDRVKNDDPRHIKSDEEMITALVDAFGIEDALHPDEISLMQMMAPTIRADVKLLETYLCEPLPKLTCPIVAIRGTKDKLVGFSEIAAWQAFTSNSCSVRAYPGGHFFLRDQQRGVVQLINRQLARRLA